MLKKKKKFIFGLGAILSLGITTSTIISCSTSFSKEEKSLQNITAPQIVNILKIFNGSVNNKFTSEQSLNPQIGPFNEWVIAYYFYSNFKISGTDEKNIGVIQLTPKPKYDYQQVFGYFQISITSQSNASKSNPAIKTVLKLELLKLSAAHCFWNKNTHPNFFGQFGPINNNPSITYAIKQNKS